MNAIIWIIIIATSIWVYFDAKKIGVGKVPNEKGVLNMGPVAWTICSLLLWIIIFPLYLIKRPTLKKKSQDGIQPPNAPSNSQKKMSKVKLGCLGVMVVLILLAIIGSFLPDSNIPKTIKIQSDQICFRQWNDVEEFNTELSQAIDVLMGGKQLMQLSDAEATDIGKKSQEEIQALKAKFETDGRLWDIPVGTEIKISKYYDGKGNEITPVWNEQ